MPGTNFFVDSLERGGAEAILEQLPQSTAMMKTVQIRMLGGALARVSNDSHAPSPIAIVGPVRNVAAMYADPAEKDTHDAWAAGLARSARRRDGAGGYVGFMGEEVEETVRAAYPGGHWERLRGLKRRYDPDNLFRLNHNIPPADG